MFKVLIVDCRSPCRRRLKGLTLPRESFATTTIKEPEKASVTLRLHALLLLLKSTRNDEFAPDVRPRRSGVSKMYTLKFLFDNLLQCMPRLAISSDRTQGRHDKKIHRSLGGGFHPLASSTRDYAGASSCQIHNGLRSRLRWLSLGE